MEVRRFDLTEQDVLDLGGSEGGFGSHGVIARGQGVLELVKNITRSRRGQEVRVDKSCRGWGVQGVQGASTT
jgi:hypothetical protein